MFMYFEHYLQQSWKAAQWSCTTMFKKPRQLANYNSSNPHLRGVWNMQVRSSVWLKTDLRGLNERALHFFGIISFGESLLALASTAHRLSEHCTVYTADNFIACPKTLNSRTATNSHVKVILLLWQSYARVEDTLQLSISRSTAPETTNNYKGNRSLYW